jgi:hypothetical protein
MAHVMSRKCCKPLNTSDPVPQPLEATVHTTKPRLVQHSAPAIALQVLLGMMTLWETPCFVLMPKVKFLPHDPCSIADTAYLLADKEF